MASCTAKIHEISQENKENEERQTANDNQVIPIIESNIFEDNESIAIKENDNDHDQKINVENDNDLKIDLTIFDNKSL